MYLKYIIFFISHFTPTHEPVIDQIRITEGKAYRNIIVTCGVESIKIVKY